MSNCCDPTNYNPPVSSVHVIFQARILVWVAIPSPEDLPNPGMEPASPAWQADSLPLILLGSPKEQLGYTYFNNNPYFKLDAYCCSSLLFSCSVVSDTLWIHGLQHARLPCPSPSPEVCSDSCPLSRWCHPTVSSSVVPFSSCLLSFPASGSFLMSPLFASDGQSIGASASVSLLPTNIQDWFP